MNQICGGCNRGAPFDGPYDITRQCRLCWLYHNNEAYRALWSAPAGSAQSTLRYPIRQRQSTSCVHLLPPTGEQRDCEGCGARKGVAIHGCTKHGRCSPGGRLLYKENGAYVEVANCLLCKDYQPQSEAKRIVLRNRLSPGDVLVMSAALECLHQQHPGKFLTAVDTSAADIWDHNPHVWVPRVEDRAEMERVGATAKDVTDIQFSDGAKGRLIPMSYPLIHQSGQRPVHFLEGYVSFLAEKLDIPLELTVNRPSIYLSDLEKSWKGRVEEILGERKPYWLVCSGVKKDYTAKGWGRTNYQNVVLTLKDKIQFVQVGASEHLHSPLEGVINQVGKTSLRELVRLVYHADGVLCGTTFLMHLAAALEKPAVVVAGGREPKSWNVYPRQVLLSTVGQLSCCASAGCWRSRTVPLGDGDEKDKHLCEQPVEHGRDTIPRCMKMIRPGRVVEEILNFYDGGVLA